MGSKRAGRQGNQAGSAPVAVALPADFRIGAQVELHAGLLEALRAGWVEVDGGAVERTDTAGLQHLLLLRMAIERAEGSFTWKGASKALGEAAETLGLRTILQLPAAGLA